MGRWKRKLLWLTFFGSFGFAGGGVLLLFGLVPLQQRLATSGSTQHEIDQTLSFFVFGWFLFTLLVTALYSRFTLQHSRPAAALLIAGAMLATAGFVFHEFLYAKSWMVAGRIAQVEEVSDRLSFGPYPDKEQLEQLKQQGYDGVISLLHPAIPFEAVLLEEEKKNGAEVGLKVYDFPMLPWISENRVALKGIQPFLKDPEHRYYIHCYLGRHRVNLVRRMAGYGTSREDAAGYSTLPDRLDGGALFNYDDGRVLVGPFPTDAEWFEVILRHGVREVVSTLDPADGDDRRQLEKLRQISHDYDFLLIERPLEKHAPDPAAVRRLADYLKKDDRKVFVVGYRTDQWAVALDRAMGGRETASSSPLGQDAFERGPLLKVNDAVVLGPYPTDAEVAVLQRAGVRAVVSLLDDSHSDWVEKEARWAQENHFVLRRFPLNAGNVTRARLEDISVYVFNQPGLTYVHSFRTDDQVKELYRTMRRMIRE